MKKLTSLVALFLMCFGITANAQLKHVGLDISTEQGLPVVKVVDETGKAIKGATAELTSSHAAHKAPKSKNFFMPSMNAKDMTAESFITMTFVINGLPSELSYNTVDMDLHALTGAYAYQNNADNEARKYNVEVLIGKDETNLTAFGALNDFDIAAGVGAYKDVHKIWSVKNAASSTTTGKALTVRLLVKKGTVNKGCFFGISKLVLADKNQTDLEAEEAAKKFAAAKAEWAKLAGCVGFYKGSDVKAASKLPTLAEAEAHLATCAKIEFLLDEYYCLVNVKRGVAANVNAAGQQCADPVDGANVGQLWQFVKAGENYTLVHANHQKYVAAPVNNNGNWLTALAPQEQALTLTMSTLTAPAQYAFSFSTAEGIRYFGAGGVGNKYVFGVNQDKLPNKALENSDAAWYLRPVEQIEVFFNPTNKETPNAAQECWVSIHLPFAAKAGNGALGIKYYGVSAVGASSATLKEFNGVPANQGVILYANSMKKGFYNLKIGKHAKFDEPAKPFENLLKGTNVAMPKTATSLVLGNGAQGVGLYAPLAENLKANKAYLDNVAGVNGLKFVLDEVTGVESVEIATPVDNVYYDLSGRRIANPVKGFYILNGKKVYVK